MTVYQFPGPADRQLSLRCRYMADLGGAQLFVYARSLGTVLRIDGQIDASNAPDVAEAIRRFARLKTPLILDLSQLSFLSVDGLRSLLVLNREHQKAGVHCSLVIGHATRRLLRIVNDHGLPVADSVPEALQMIEDIVWARRQLLAAMIRPRRRVVAIPS